MRPIAISGTSAPATRSFQTRDRSLHALETAAPAILALAIATESRASAFLEAAQARAALSPAAEAAPAPDAAAVAEINRSRFGRQLQWQSVAQLTIGKPPRAPRVEYARDLR